MKLLLVLLQSINILWFGHSYGVDSTELLPQIASEAGVENLYIGRFVKGNCSVTFNIKPCTEAHALKAFAVLLIGLTNNSAV